MAADVSAFKRRLLRRTGLLLQAAGESMRVLTASPRRLLLLFRDTRLLLPTTLCT